MKKILFIVLIAVFLSLPAFAESEKELFEKGVHFLKQNKNQEAVDTFSALIAIAPQNLHAYKNRGVAHLKLNQYDKAIADFEWVNKIMPDLKGLYSNLGVAWYYKKDYPKAIENYNKEIAQSPDNSFAYFNRALCRAELKDYDKSLKDTIKSLELSPDYYQALCLKGTLYENMNLPQKAIQAYENAILVDPDTAYAREKLEELMLEHGPMADVQEKNIPMSQTGIVIKKIPPREMPSDTVHESGTADKEAEKASSLGSAIHPPPTSINYELQAGAYRVRRNALVMQKKLKNKGVKARILELTRSSKITWYLVRTGAYSLKKDAESHKKIIKNNSGIDFIVRPFEQF